ncbi:RICIN domain-containing protein [Nonomuraea sp. NPDC050536]|uniref:RICIN domain-containing protein n=1 Tax=Nonomuraea sp. NPDC050536 TaxID=3364366 RepID=UPI0037C55995
MKRDKPPRLATGSTAARFARKAALLSVGATMAFAAIPALTAHADGRVQWKNLGMGRYLEVYKSSKQKGAIVGAWPGNGSKTQYWYDVKLSKGGYYAEFNYNSKLLLTAYTDCNQGVTQWPTSPGNYAYTTQQWREHHLSSDEGWALINKAGCSGNEWTDILSIHPQHPDWYNVYLFSEKSGPCDISYWPDAGPQSYCLWK